MSTDPEWVALAFAWVGVLVTAIGLIYTARAGGGDMTDEMMP